MLYYRTNRTTNRTKNFMTPIIKIKGDVHFDTAVYYHGGTSQCCNHPNGSMPHVILGQYYYGFIWSTAHVSGDRSKFATVLYGAASLVQQNCSSPGVTSETQVNYHGYNTPV